MNTLAISIGNRLRGDDAVAHIIAAQLNGIPTREVHQLTPEIAPDLAGLDLVIFIDADIEAKVPTIDPLPPPAATRLTHVLTPAEVVHLARTLYNFTGQAYLCRVPASHFDREGLSPAGRSAAAQTLALLNKFVLDNIRC
jgi:Ni,Fe-hydrogenase maturation factor